MELFEIVDDDDNVIGTAPRSECHGNPALIHRVVHVLVVNGKGDMLLQKRSLHKDIQPGKWDTSVGGHLVPGESYHEAASREMGEELGLTGLPLTFLYKSKIRNAIESENIATFLTRYDGDVRWDEHEITAVRFWGADEIEAALGKEVFTPNFEEEWALYQSFQRRYVKERASGLGLCAGDSMPDVVKAIDQD
ncbi:MAG: NUDIX domain-containing protein [Desulfuromonas sp.]|nr:NUDIX domain-containing protein [Desulfuromonas sp.]